MNIVGVNGIATHGEGNIDLLLRHVRLRGWDTVDVPLPKRHFISAWWGHEKDGERIADYSKDGDVVVCHSYGGPRTAEAMLKRNYAAVIFINPAMDQYHPFARKGIYCLHSTDDWIVKVGSLIPYHPFGRAGVVGFRDPNVTNINIGGGHSHAFREHLMETVRLVDNVARSIV